jgi:hypothetical protein
MADAVSQGPRGRQNATYTSDIPHGLLTRCFCKSVVAQRVLWTKEEDEHLERRIRLQRQDQGLTAAPRYCSMILKILRTCSSIETV